MFLRMMVIGIGKCSEGKCNHGKLPGLKLSPAHPGIAVDMSHIYLRCIVRDACEDTSIGVNREARLCRGISIAVDILSKRRNSILRSGELRTLTSTYVALITSQG